MVTWLMVFVPPLLLRSRSIFTRKEAAHSFLLQINITHTSHIYSKKYKIDKEKRGYEAGRRVKKATKHTSMCLRFAIQINAHTHGVY